MDATTPQSEQQPHHGSYHPSFRMHGMTPFAFLEGEDFQSSALVCKNWFEQVKALGQERLGEICRFIHACESTYKKEGDVLLEKRCSLFLKLPIFKNSRVVFTPDNQPQLIELIKKLGLNPSEPVEVEVVFNEIIAIMQGLCDEGNVDTARKWAEVLPPYHEISSLLKRAMKSSLEEKKVFMSEILNECLCAIDLTNEGFSELLALNVQEGQYESALRLAEDYCTQIKAHRVVRGGEFVGSWIPDEVLFLLLKDFLKAGQMHFAKLCASSFLCLGKDRNQPSLDSEIAGVLLADCILFDYHKDNDIRCALGELIEDGQYGLAWELASEFHQIDNGTAWEVVNEFDKMADDDYALHDKGKSKQLVQKFLTNWRIKQIVHRHKLLREMLGLLSDGKIALAGACFKLIGASYPKINVYSGRNPANPEIDADAHLIRSGYTNINEDYSLLELAQNKLVDTCIEKGEYSNAWHWAQECSDGSSERVRNKLNDIEALSAKSLTLKLVSPIGVGLISSLAAKWLFNKEK